jgi:hypothetical protein
MRISDDRYSRDRLRLDIALHFIRHEARTHTIREWTGLTDDRIRKLYRSYLQAGGCRVVRHRGKSPQQTAVFLRSSRLRHEAGAFAGLCCLAGLFDGRRALPQQRPPWSIGCAAALIQAYDAYSAAVGTPALAFEHAALLVNALALGHELRLGDCQGCGVLLVVDALALRAARCILCAPEPARRPPGAARGARTEPVLG